MDIRKEARELTPPHAVWHYTVKEMAKIWNLSADTIVRIFENEPGVIVISERRKHSIIIAGVSIVHCESRSSW